LVSHFRFGSRAGGSKTEAGRGVPGPGSYDLKHLVGNEGIKSSLTARRPDSASYYGRNVPGPGAYSPLRPKDTPSFK
jgi:hypothetical protein